jgi:hypothetical protein
MESTTKPRERYLPLYRERPHGTFTVCGVLSVEERYYQFYRKSLWVQLRTETSGNCRFFRTEKPREFWSEIVENSKEFRTKNGQLSFANWRAILRLAVERALDTR